MMSRSPSLKAGKKLRMITIKNKKITPYIQKLELNLSAIEKGGFRPFHAERDLRTAPFHPRLHEGTPSPVTQGLVTLGGIRDYSRRSSMPNASSSPPAEPPGMQDLSANTSSKSLQGSRLKWNTLPSSGTATRSSTRDDVVIAISQSGETADTLAAIELAKSKGATVLGICNVVGSSIARATHAGVYTHAGPEIGVASTKAFTAQVAVLTLLALELAQQKGTIPASQLHETAAGTGDASPKKWNGHWR